MNDKLYVRLRGAMVEREITQEDIALKLRMNRRSINRRFMGEQSWGLDEAYAVLKLLSIPAEEVYEYFPPNGQTIARKPHLKVIGG